MVSKLSMPEHHIKKVLKNMKNRSSGTPTAFPSIGRAARNGSKNALHYFCTLLS